MTRFFTLLSLSIISFSNIYAQTAQNFWTPSTLSTASRAAHLPAKGQAFDLNFLALKTAVNSPREAASIFALPMPDGSFQNFKIQESEVMHPDLAVKFPEIKTFNAVSVSNPLVNGKIDVTEKGFHALIFSPDGGSVLIDPIANGNTTNYLSFYKKDGVRPSDFHCGADDFEQPIFAENNAQNRPVGTCVYRVYSLALACTGEYATFHGGTTSAVMSAFATTLNRVNGVFEREFSTHLTLVANNDLLIYLNSATDPYTNNDGITMLSENQTTVDAIIGNGNYDVGHVFSTGGGGIAYRGAICFTGYKAGGVTGLSSPFGDAFDVDFVCHEMGHQFGGSHTMNNNCNREDAFAFEPGSGSTIMAYTGVCLPNIQPHSDDYFHLANLYEIQNVITGYGGTCANSSSNINTGPTSEAGANYTIPKSTPFALTGTGTDANDTGLTYCWEQFDNGIAAQPPASTHTTSPLFRSLPPSASPTRYFPNLNTILNNSASTWEVLPSVARTMNFKMTVRDNHTGGGCAAEDSTIITVSGTAGPFAMSNLNTAAELPKGSTQTISWNVAGTDIAPVNCTNIDILLSKDGGLTYPVTLAANTANDGSENIVFPDEDIPDARIMLRSVGNVFFDVNNANFSLKEIDLCTNPPVLSALQVYDAVATPDDNHACHDTPINFGINTNFGTGTGTLAYNWTTDPMANAQITGGQGGNFLNVNFTNTGNSNLDATVQVVVTDSLGCTDTASVVIGISPFLQIDTIYKTENSGTPDDGGICFGDSINYSVSALPLGAYSYTWSHGLTGQTITFAPEYNNTNAVYYVTVSDAFGCSASLFTNAKGFTEIVASGEHFYTCDPAVGDTITVNVSGGNPTPSGYLFQTDAMPFPEFLQSPWQFVTFAAVDSTVIVYIKDEKGCELELGVSAVADSSIYEICPGESFTLTAHPDAVQVVWFKNGSPISGATAATFDVTEAGEYYYEGNNASGCAVEACCPVYFVPGGRNCLACPPRVCLPVRIVRN